jgi:nickel transport protein
VKWLKRLTTEREKTFCLTLAATMVLCLLGSQAQAHKVNVFAYVEGKRLVVEGYFSGNVKAQDCLVQVFDATGKKIHEGKTDRNGIYSLKLADLPAFSGGLRIVLEAGMGHRAEYALNESDIPGSQKKGPPPKEQSPQSGSEGVHRVPIAGSAQVLDQAALMAALEKVLDKKLEPLVKMLGRQEALLLEQKYGGPKISDIVGGIGWILGLVGLATFFWRRGR